MKISIQQFLCHGVGERRTRRAKAQSRREDGPAYALDPFFHVPPLPFVSLTCTAPILRIFFPVGKREKSLT